VVDEKQCFPSWHFDAVLRYTAGTSGWGSPFHSLAVREAPASAACAIYGNAVH